MTVIFLFHRDLRLEDNLPLQSALDFAEKNKLEVLPLFIFTPEQVSDKAPIRSLKSISCMIQSLKEVDEGLRSKFKSELCVMYDDNIKAIDSIDKQIKVSAIFETKDYTPYAKQRENKIKNWCENKKVHFEAIDYLYLNAPGDILNKSGKIYQKFTPYYEASLKKSVDKSLGIIKGDFMNSKEVSKISNISLDKMFGDLELDDNEIEERMYYGGRKEGLDLLSTLPKNYDKIRDVMKEETSGLSVHHHFGTVSIRESYWAAKEQLSGKSETDFIRQLYWRDFYGQLMSYFKELYGVDTNDFEKDWKLSKEDEENYKKWCSGTTGVDIVDAAMTQLNKSGYLQNRARLLVSSYLMRDLNLPWKLGEEYFAEKLLDYDISQNSLNWLNQRSGFPFSRPPFRRDDPVNYKKRFDPKGEYIKEWI
jgi:deoxyribodipyrimidine photo-lyase